MGAGLRVGVNDMATTRPDLAAELVGTDPTTVMAGTNRVLLWRCPNHTQPYPAKGNDRVRGSGCGYCRNLRVLPGFNDMASTHPKLAAELVETDPTTVIARTDRVLLWRCANHSTPFPARGSDRVKGGGCGYCAGQKVLPGFNDMATTHPGLAAELVGTDPRTILAGSHRVLLWRCPSHTQPYAATGTARALRGSGCGYCSGRQVLPGFNDMATTHPELAAELVGTDPTTVQAGTNRRLTWRCANHPVSYDAKGYNRLSGHGCPYCAGQKVLPGFNDMATTHPELAAELVGTDPATIVAGTSRVLEWKCPHHEATYRCTGAVRLRGVGCGYCANLRLLPGVNDMATTHPRLAAELVGTDPASVVAGSNKRMQWQCAVCGHSWETTPSNRRLGSGCPKCAPYGFNPGQPAWMYVMVRHGEQQVGITGDLTLRTQRHARFGWSLLDSEGPMPGHVAQQREARIKQYLRLHVGTLAGTTENWSTASLEVSSLRDLWERAAAAPSDPRPQGETN